MKKGLELSRDYYNAFGRQMLDEQFAELMPYLAAGVCGSGSECLGFDDENSRDHDFDPGFCIFLPDEETVSRRDAFLLERAYAKLPRTFEGAARPYVQPVGGARRGVLRIEDFLMEKTGTKDGVLDLYQWLNVPEQSLLEVVNGEIYFDNYGKMTEIRKRLHYYPEDIQLKKLAGHLLLMGQSGQYNFERCMRHGEKGAAQLALYEFVKSALSVLFLLNRQYQPFYKWTFRAAKNLTVCPGTAEKLERLLCAGSMDGAGNMLDEDKAMSIDQIADDILASLRQEGLTDTEGRELELHAYEVNSRVRDSGLRNMHVLAAV